MSNIITITLRKNLKDFYLLFWSIILPLAVLIGMYYFKVQLSTGILFGILSVALFFYCCTTNSFYIYAQRKRGIFDLLRITPFSLWRYLGAITISQTVVACVVATLLLFVERFLFNLNLTGIQALQFLPLFFLGASIFSLIGFALSAIPKNEGQLSIVSNLVMIPLVVCSPMVFNLETAPALVRWISFINPFARLHQGYLAALSGQAADYWLSLAFLIGLLVISLVLAKRSFKVGKI
ncbi:ABC transporter permease [Enterococcus sp. 669A]|uniref:Transport permease protein n=1 Tax=Candidatus Enterococcus moelleringii TaxID=2815325 RepID=A0ABS3LEP5_9ENTE|nr:ABC transporter permease [Enterococcus sp. 669A]MBO1308112.1 ABC transporter permease [Enterococcus sp. 669A]